MLGMIVALAGSAAGCESSDEDDGPNVDDTTDINETVDAGTIPPPPATCNPGCVLDHPPEFPEDCCYAASCWYDETSGAWMSALCNEDPDPCEACTADEICVAKYNNSCQGGGECVPKTVDCPDFACTEACELAYCGNEPYQCQVRVGCGGIESPLAFTCYGP